MSRSRRKAPPGLSGQETMRRLLGPLEGARIPGGCDECDAYQTAAPVEAGVWSVTVHHDDRCPWYQRERGAA